MIIFQPYIELSLIDFLLCYITGALGKAPSKVTDALPDPVALPAGATAALEDEEEEEEEDIEEMQSRLAALRS